jgi:hypothetical protein
MVKPLYLRAFVASWLLLLPIVASAQDHRFDVSGQVVFSTSEFETTDIGVGARAGWRPSALFGIEGELTVFPSDFPESAAPISGSRVEALFGATFGPRIGRARLFGRVRPGLLRFGEAPAPIACILIFPPPLSCELAAGKTLFALDVGGGAEFDMTPRSFVRVDVGDRLVRYPDPVFRPEGTAADDGFYGHDLRVAIGGGVRF